LSRDPSEPDLIYGGPGNFGRVQSGCSRHAGRSVSALGPRLKVLVEELYPDNLLTQVVGALERPQLRRWPYAVAIAVTLRDG
jgi:hypothetical protein